MQVRKLMIPDLLLVRPKKHGDQRGFFPRHSARRFLAAQGVRASFVPDNHVRSTQKGVLRGLHYQTPPHAQGKLVRCARGSILDVAAVFGLAPLPTGGMWRWSYRRRTGTSCGYRLDLLTVMSRWRTTAKSFMKLPIIMHRIAIGALPG
jgi:dTDP-4-dehydrorhamnose 3,5-epimerase